MNSNTLRIRGSEYKTRGGITFDPVVIPDFYKPNLGKTSEGAKFLEAGADQQLKILKCVLNNKSKYLDGDTVSLLVIIFLQAETKHPAKCIIARYVTKNNCIQEQFRTILMQELKYLLTTENKDYRSYANVISKIANCTENFPTGAAAVKNIEIIVAKYFEECLSCCITTLRDVKSLSPTEKNKIYNLSHSTLRLTLYIVQKVQEENILELTSIFNGIRNNLKYLLFDMDAPMDTKSVCGILFIYMHILENNSDSWIDILESNKDFDILSNESAKLSLYSALVTVIPMDKLQVRLNDGTPAIVRLTNKILDIGERYSAESIFILGVTRTLVQICKGLHKIDDLALTIIDGLFIFIWSHLEHYTDSVRHLTAQALGFIIKYCAYLKEEGREEAINKLFTTLTSLDRQRKSFYLSVTCLANELGAVDVMDQWPGIVDDTLNNLHVQAIQACVTTCLETLLQKHIEESSTDIIFKEWVTPVLHHIVNNELDSSVLNILENLLTLAIKCDKNIMDYILPYIKESCENDTLHHSDIKCLLILLCVVRKSGQLLKLVIDNDNAKWKDIISYDILKMAAVDASEEIRILLISLIVESPKSTEGFAKGELDLILWFVKYNMNTQMPHFRQLILSVIKKFLKRFESSYKSIIKENDPANQINKGQHYLTFLDQLQDMCYEGLIRGANFSRRYVALLLLTWVAKLEMDLYCRKWNEEQVEVLLQHLGDSYENNKALALEMLEQCPLELLTIKEYSTSLNLKDILAEASSVKPTDCVTAVYKLKLLRKRLPDYIVLGNDSIIPNKVKFALLNILLEELQKQLSICKESIVYGARNAPMYGILHCIGYSIDRGISPFGLSPGVWTQSIQMLVTACVEICACAGDVLNSAAPEGMMPTPCEDASGNIKLEDGSEVTAQMVLLCAWRSVKEVSLVLSTIVTEALCYEDFEPATLRYNLVKTIGELFTQLLTETKHRGAFEQVYVGFTRLLTNLWRRPTAEYNELPKQWLNELMSAIESGDNGKLCATRRSAGLPFMIQALVITELQVKLNSKSFDVCIKTLIRVAHTASSVETRCHCLNILRALYRNTHLDEIVGTYVGDGLLVALQGFESNTWIERNSSTLLFSALMVRIFGVQRSKDTDNLCVRNRMTGRIFFLRYPKLYDFMLDKLKEVTENKADQLLRPSLYPVLLLLARLYPSSLEGTVSNLKLTAFIPHVVSCGHSAVLKTRQLAAKAMPPLISPHLYISHIESMFQLLCDTNIRRNFCHGILLQLLKLFESKPEDLSIDEESRKRLILLIEESSWILKQSLGVMPCYVIADEYIKIINILLWRYKSLITETFMKELQNILNDLLFNNNNFQVNPGKELCQSNAVYLNLILHTLNKTDIQPFIYKCLSHNNYEIVLSALNYLLIVHNELEIENNFQEHLNEICNKSMKMFENNEKYTETLCCVIKSKYLECTQKSLKLVTLEGNTQKQVIEAKLKSSVNDELVLVKLIDFVNNEHENLTHIYLDCLCSYVHSRLDKLTDRQILEAIRVIYNKSLSGNSDETRKVVVEFLVHNVDKLLEFNFTQLREEEKFEFKATLYATIITTLEDDDETLRLATSRAITSQSVIPAVAAERMMEVISRDADSVMLLSLIAMLDFKAEVCMTDDVNDECRVFDHNEKYNVYLEEVIWTRACAKRIKENTDNIQTLYSEISKPKYFNTFQTLCNDNLILFEKLLNRETVNLSEINPKIDIFVKILNR